MLAVNPATIHRDRAVPPTRQVGISDLVRLYGDKVLEDAHLLASHLADGDPQISARLGHLAAKDADPSGVIADMLVRCGPLRSVAETLRVALVQLDSDHPLARVAGPVTSAHGAFDLRRKGDALAYHGGSGQELAADTVVLLVSPDNAAVSWRICKVISVSDEGAVMLQRLAESNIHVSGRQMEKPAYVISVAGLADIVDQMQTDAGFEEPLLASPDWNEASRKDGGDWRIHVVPAEAEPVVTFDQCARLSANTTQRTIVALHQTIKPHRRLGGYRFGVQWRSLKGDVMVAIRLLALRPTGAVVLDQHSVTITPGQGWLTVDKVFFGDSEDPLHFEVGALNLDADIVVELRSPSLSAVSSLWVAEPGVQ